MVYTLQERTEIIFVYGAEDRCARRTARVFNERHAGQNVSHRYVVDLVQKFEETGRAVKPPRFLTEAAQIEILCQVAKLVNISVGSTHKVSKRNKFFPCKMRILQELSEDDCDRRIEFCERMTARIQNDPNLT